MSLFIFTFLLFSLVSAFRVDVINSPTAGGTAQVQWERDRNDDRTFWLRLRKDRGNDNGPLTKVESNGRDEGVKSITTQEAGNYIIEVFVPNNFSPRASSRTFEVKSAAPADPPETTPQEHPTETPGNPTSSSTPSAQPVPPTTKPTDPNNGSNPPPSDTETSHGNDPTSSPSPTATATNSSHIVVTDPFNGKPVTTLSSAATTPQVFTFVSDDLTMTTTVSPPVETSEGGAGDTQTSGAASKSKSNVGAIVGGVLASLAFLLFVALFVLYRRRKRRQATNTFFRDKMVRSGSNHFPQSPSQSALTFQNDTPRSDIPYSDLDEKIQDYDQTHIAGDPHGNTAASASRSTPADFDPYSAMYERHASVDAEQGLFTLPKKSIDRSLVPSLPPAAASTSSLGLGAPRTDQQMQIQTKIMKLQGRMINLQSWLDRLSTGSAASVAKETTEVQELKKKISDLEALMDSDWALGRTHIVPSQFLEADK